MKGELGEICSIVRIKKRERGGCKEGERKGGRLREHGQPVQEGEREAVKDREDDGER